MPDNLSYEQRHKAMAAIHSISTRPELKLRLALWHRGFRYRVNVKRLLGTPDIVLPKYHTVIFIHGCFWHGHNGCKYYTIPKTNTVFWTAKVARNQERDQKVWRELEAMGWSVIVVWECQLKKKCLEETAARVAKELLHNGEMLRRFQVERREAKKKYRQECRTRKEREKELLTEIKRL